MEKTKMDASPRCSGRMSWPCMLGCEVFLSHMRKENVHVEGDETQKLEFRGYPQRSSELSSLAVMGPALGSRTSGLVGSLLDKVIL